MPCLVQYLTSHPPIILRVCDTDRNFVSSDLGAYVLTQDLKVRVLEAYVALSTRKAEKVEAAAEAFTAILEETKDYLPALLGLSTAFMLQVRHISNFLNLQIVLSYLHKHGYVSSDAAVHVYPID